MFKVALTDTVSASESDVLPTQQQVQTSVCTKLALPQAAQITNTNRTNTTIPVDTQVNA